MFAETVSGPGLPRAPKRRLDPGSVPPGRVIAAVRAMCNVRADLMAEALGVTPALLSRLEREQRISTPEELLRVWEVLGRFAFGLEVKHARAA